MANPLFKLYCRVVQKAFLVGVHVLPWREPEIVSGAGSLEKLPALLKGKGFTRILIVTDKFLAGTPHFTQMISLMDKAEIKYAIYDKTIPNPTLDNVEEGLALYKAYRCNALLAFGGGSAIDCAKGIGIKYARPHTPMVLMKGMLKVMKSIPYLIAIPTTAGTGSETTVTAVLSDARTHSKYPVNDLHLIPRLAILDANITLGLPPHLTSTTGMDALTHAVEAYIGHSNFGGSAEAAIEAGQLIVQNLQTAYKDGSNITARENLQQAAYKAGFAFTRAYVGYVHAIAHSLGGMYRIPHGLANAVILPYVLEAYGKAAEKRLGQFAKAIGAVSSDLNNHDASVAFVQYVRSMNKSMDIPEHLEGIQEADIPVMAKAANAEGNPFYPVPKIFSAKELESLYRIVGNLPQA